MTTLESRQLRVIESFEPPKYISSLIQAINDAAKTAQASAITMVVLGFYLISIAFCTSDEDLLLNQATSIAQLGLQVKPQLAFGIAPVVFLALYVFALVRYDMLATNLRSLRAEIDAAIPLSADRERCRQLLSNVEFIMAFIAPRGSHLRSWIFGPLAATILAVFPVFVLIILQFSTLRYQSNLINCVQRGALSFDFLALLQFWFRADRDSIATGETAWKWFRKTIPVALVLIICIANLAWFNILSPNRAMWFAEAKWGTGLERLAAQKQPTEPLDYWDQRRLNVSYTMIFGKALPDSVSNVRRNSGALEGAIASVDGAYLVARNLRYVNLTGSELYGALLAGADMRGADLEHAVLFGADLTQTDLEYANLFSANLKKANITQARFVTTILNNADLQGVYGTGANFTGASMESVKLRGANLPGSIMYGADLSNSDLEGAKLEGSRLTAVDFDFSDLNGADLSNAMLDEAHLDGTDLTGANLNYAYIDATDLSKATLTGANLKEAEYSDGTCTGIPATKFPAHFNVKLAMMNIERC